MAVVEQGYAVLKVQRNIRCARKLAKRMLEVPKWQEELKHHTGLCLERYSDLDISRGNYLEYSDNYVRRTQTNMKYSCASKVSFFERNFFTMYKKIPFVGIFL